MNYHHLNILKTSSPLIEINRLLDRDIINDEQRYHLVKIKQMIVNEQFLNAYVLLKEMDEYGSNIFWKPLYALLQLSCLRIAYPNKTDDQILSSYIKYHGFNINL